MKPKISSALLILIVLSVPSFSHELSHTANKEIRLQQRINRMLLKTLMEKHGFKNYDLEWWHYTLKNEPYPDTYFNFPIG